MQMQLIKEKLANISSFHFTSSTNHVLNGWKGEGEGMVKTVWENENSLIFYEEGRFTNLQKRSVRCSNIYRWVFDSIHSKIGLQHLRFGFDRPVFLFDLIFKSGSRLISSSPHICSKDFYHAKMTVQKQAILLEWRIEKPGSLNKIAYQYL